MNKAALVPAWDMNRMRHGIAVRCVQALSDEQVLAKPITGMRSALEIVVHMYSFLRAAAESPLAGVVAGGGRSVHGSQRLLVPRVLVGLVMCGTMHEYLHPSVTLKRAAYWWLVDRCNRGAHLIQLRLFFGIRRWIH